MHHLFLPLAAVLSLSSASAAVIRIDFGSATNTTTEAGVTWNNLTGTTVGSNIANLTDIGGTTTEFSIEVTGAFRGTNTSGTTTSTLFPANATRDSFYGHTIASASFPAPTFPDGQLTLNGLNAFETYTLRFYASRTGDSVNRATLYTAEGGNGAQSAALNANNVNGSVVISGLTADANGRIVIDVDPGAGNTTTEQFYYIGVLEVTSVPEPAASSVMIASLAACLLRRKRNA